MPLNELIAAIDAVNAQDPNTDIVNGQSVAKELLYSQRMSECLQQFAPDASEALQIAARAQHIRRWAIPRSDYPLGRQSYKQWRTDLGKFHAETTTALMAANGYNAAMQSRVADLLQKKSLKRDADSQCLEDVICLVFIQFYLADFASKHEEDKLIDIIRKTWNKMSERGHAAALQAALPPTLGELIGKALNT